jgi:hypothetical protein
MPYQPSVGRKSRTIQEYFLSQKAFILTFGGLEVEIFLRLAGNWLLVTVRLLKLIKLELETSMKRKLLGLLLLILAVFVPTTIYSWPAPQSSDDVKTSGSLKPDKVRKGKSAQATILVEIPPGLHLQSSKPLDKFLVPTKLEVENTGRDEDWLCALTREQSYANSSFQSHAVSVYEERF